MTSAAMPSYGVLEQSRPDDAIASAAEDITWLGYSVIDAGYSPQEIAELKRIFDDTHRRYLDLYGEASLREIDEHNGIRLPLALHPRFLDVAANARVLRLVETLVEANENRKLAMARKIVKACGGVKGKTIAVLGLTFKPNTDDMRSAPSLTIVPVLQAEGARVVAFDPEGAKSAKELLPDIEFADGPYSCVQGADALVIITEWDAFRALDLARVKAALRQPIVVDLRNIYRREEMIALGFHYESLGRGRRGDKARRS